MIVKFRAMLSVQLDMLVAGAMPIGIMAVFVRVELDCFNDPTAWPIPTGPCEMVAPG